MVEGCGVVDARAHGNRRSCRQGVHRHMADDEEQPKFPMEQHSFQYNHLDRIVGR